MQTFSPGRLVTVFYNLARNIEVEIWDDIRQVNGQYTFLGDIPCTQRDGSGIFLLAGEVASPPDK